MSKDTDALIDALPTIAKRMEDRAQLGLRTYGPFDPTRDSRDLVTEAIEEVEDAMVYLAMLWVRLKKLGQIDMLRLAEEALRWRGAWKAALIRVSPPDQIMEERAIEQVLREFKANVYRRMPNPPVDGPA